MSCILAGHIRLAKLHKLMSELSRFEVLLKHFRSVSRQGAHSQNVVRSEIATELS